MTDCAHCHDRPGVKAATWQGRAVRLCRRCAGYLERTGGELPALEDRPVAMPVRRSGMPTLDEIERKAR